MRSINDKGPDVAFLKDALRLMNDAGISELEVSEGDSSLRLVAASSVGVSETQAPAAILETASTVETINAPLAGTFFVAQSPQDDPFVLEGDAIAEGQTLFIVEAMKSLTSVPAPSAGRILRRLVEDGAPIDADTPVFEVEWDASDA